MEQNKAFERGTEPLETIKDVRVCAFQHTYAHISELGPNICMLTYDFEQFRYSELLLLAKLIPGLGDRPVWPDRDSLTDYRASDIPGGLTASGRLGGIAFTAECRPFVLARDCRKRTGGITLHIKAQSGPIRLKCCTGELTNLMELMSFCPAIQSEDMCCENGSAELAEGGLHLFSSRHPLHIYIKGNFTAEICRLPGAAEGKGTYGMLYCPDSELYLTAAFAQQQADAVLAAADPREEAAKSAAYYADLLARRYIKTPEANLDNAFMHASLQLEYGWFRPYGWAESLHHWVSMWHMEHTAAEEWAGNAQRTREVLTAQLENLTDSDDVPEFCAPGIPRTHWGGDNPYFFRCIEHYLKMTGDRDFAVFARPYMRRILARTFRRYDPAGSGIMGFGTQLGNQEDFEGTPGMGSASGLEGAHMLEVMALAEELAGSSSMRDSFMVWSRYVKNAVYKRLWLSDVGRFAWYEDGLGQLRLDPAYHSICFPVSYGMIDECGMVSSVDHLLHRMTGPDGEMYISNHFGGHCYHDVCTWGMQCGANMQQAAAAAYARLGMNSQAVRPLRFVADAVCGRHGGSFPETANEPFKAYFTPAACKYLQGITEAVFGLNRDMLSGVTFISPCFPEEWEHAEIRLPEAHLRYTRQNGRHIFRGEFPDGTEKVFLWRLPPYSGISALLNGKPAAVSTTAHCGWFEAEIRMGTASSFELSVLCEPLKLTVDGPGCIAEGDVLRLSPKGASIVGVRDECGLFCEVSVHDNSLRAVLKSDLLQPYERFGWFGRINFARRTFFLELEAGLARFTYPVHLTLLPGYICSAALDKNILTVSVRRCRRNAVCRPATLLFAAQALTSEETVFAPGADVRLSFVLPPAMTDALTPGRNTARLCIGDYCADISFDAQPQTAPEIKCVHLEENMLKPADYWGVIGRSATPPDSTLFCLTGDDFLSDVFALKELPCIIPGVPFEINKAGFIPVSARRERHAVIPLQGLRARKLYVLMAAFITNQHAFSSPFLMELEALQEEEYFRPVFAADLCFPGDLDIGLSGKGMYGFPTYAPEQPRGVLPPLPRPGDADYPGACPPDYPQHLLWNMRRAVQVGQTVFTVIELSLDRERSLEKLTLTAAAQDAAAGIYAVSAL